MKTQSQREYEARLTRNRQLAHRSAPLNGGGGWSSQCARPGCAEVFISPTRQRRYCSDRCRRDETDARARLKRRESALLRFECAAPRCGNSFTPKSPQHVYCSARCRKRGHRSAGDLSPTNCLLCGGKLLERTQRKRFCSARCRVRHARSAEQPHKPVRIQQ